MPAIGTGIYVGRDTGRKPTPITILGAASVVAWYRSDDPGIIVAGAGVDTWPDKTGNGHTLRQTTDTNRPSLQATGGPNSRPSVLFDGVDNFLVNTTLDRPAPGTQPTLLWVIFRQISWTSTDTLLGFGIFPEVRLSISQAGVSPAVTPNNGAVGSNNSGSPINTYTRGKVFFNNATSDYIKLRSTNVTGTNAGNLDPGAGWFLGVNAVQASFGNIEVCEFIVINRDLTAGEDAQMDAYGSGLYGSGVLA